MEIWDAVERLGGWAVVVWIVIWFTRRIQQRDVIVEKMVSHFANFEKEEGETHAKIVIALDGILKSQREMHQVVEKINHLLKG